MHDIIVLKKKISEDKAWEIIDDKKTSVFKSILKRIRKKDVHVHYLRLYYECVLIISGRYSADYYRKTNHTISVDNNVMDIVFGGETFPVRSKSTFNKMIPGKSKIDLPLDEHIFIQEEDEITLDHHGKTIKISFKTDTKNIESYPKRLLEESDYIRRSELDHDKAISKLKEALKKSLDSNIRDLNEEFVLDNMKELYMPVYEARLVGPNKKVKLLRLDAVRKKII